MEGATASSSVQTTLLATVYLAAGLQLGQRSAESSESRKPEGRLCPPTKLQAELSPSSTGTVDGQILMMIIIIIPYCVRWRRRRHSSLFVCICESELLLLLLLIQLGIQPELCHDRPSASQGGVASAACASSFRPAYSPAR